MAFPAQCRDGTEPNPEIKELIMSNARQVVYHCIFRNVGSRDRYEELREHVAVKLLELEIDYTEDQTPGFLSYNVPGKPRMKMKVHRILTRKLGLSDFMGPCDIQNIGDNIIGELFGTSTELLTGDDITDAYKNEVGGYSCMTGDESRYTRLYAENPDVYQMLTMWMGSNESRAMVIKLDNDEYLMDRIYSDSQTLTQKMFDYVKKQGWNYRSSTSPGCYDIIGPDGCEVDYEDIYVTGLDYELGEVPYMDTLTKGRIWNGLLDLMHPSSKKAYDFEVTSTCGEVRDLETCCNCGDETNEDDRMCSDSGETWCSDCYNEYFSYCDNCKEDVPTVDIVCLGNDYICESYRDAIATWCDECRRYVKNDDMITISDTGLEVCRECAENEYSYCDGCGEYCSETHETIDGDMYCKECAPDIDETDESEMIENEA